VKKMKKFCLMLVLAAAAVYAAAEGRVTTQAGDLFLEPAGGDVVVDGNLGVGVSSPDIKLHVKKVFTGDLYSGQAPAFLHVHSTGDMEDGGGAQLVLGISDANNPGFSGIGIVDGQLRQISESRRIYHTDIHGEHWSAIQITTAASLCAVVDLFFKGHLPDANFIKQEDISFDMFINNRFGKYFHTHNS